MKTGNGFLGLAGIWIVICGWSGCLNADDAGVTASGNINSAEMVRPLATSVLQAQPRNERSVQLAQAFYDSIAAWGNIIWKQIKPVPGHIDWSYYGLDGHQENDVRPICYAVMVNAFLAEVGPPQERLTLAERNQARAHAISCLRYLTQAHITGGGACVNGKPWGNQWQSALWCRAAGLGGWLLWEHLDVSQRQAVATMVAYEADRFIDKKPKSSVFRDTGAEENAWNALVISLAYNMMPDHPHAQQWDRAAKIYLYNTFSVKADQEDTTIGDDGKAVNDWVTTVNAHPDFTVENHGLVHVGYLKNALGSLLENACVYQLTGRPTPRALLHHADDALAVLKKCMSWDGVGIYFGGNDWKIVHSQSADVSIYTTMSQVAGDDLAAAFEDVAVEALSAIQREEKGFYNVRRDLEYGGFCATRLMSAYWLHALVGRDCKPLTPESLHQQLSQVTFLETAKAIVHRTPTKFASFAWGPKRMALSLPENGTWVIWPHFSSYLGYINNEDSSDKHAKLTRLHPELLKDGFAVVGALERCQGKVTQDFAFISLSGDITVYIERLRGETSFQLTQRETGVIGHEYELGKNTRMLYGDFGKVMVQGTGNAEQIHAWDSDWFNVGDKVGYVVKRVSRTGGKRPASPKKNVIRYHDKAKGDGRVPKLQEWFSLIGEAEMEIPSEGEWACIVTLLNQTSTATQASVDNVVFSAVGDTATCRIGDKIIKVDFGGGRVTFKPDADWVIRFPQRALTMDNATPRSKKLMQQYYNSLYDWSNVLAEHFQTVKGQPDWGYYGDANVNNIRQVCYAAMVNAFLAKVNPASGGPDIARRQRLRQEAIAALRYLTQAHVTGGGRCVNVDKPWGDDWQSAMWCRAAGLAGWLIWDDLDDSLQEAVARMVAHEADRFIDKKPKSSVHRDTGAEENAWNSQVVSLAQNMMPDHPHAPAWDKAAKIYMYNTFSVEADHDNQTIGDDGKKIKDWVTTVNAHGDFTVENHGLVHVGYMKNSLAMLLVNAPLYFLNEATPPDALTHHAEEVLSVLMRCMAWDGAAISFGGNDWKLVHPQGIDVASYGIYALLTGDSSAAYLEEIALDYALRLQREENGFYNIRRDLAWGGLCSTRMIAAWLAHATSETSPVPINDAEFNQRASGVTFLEHGDAILHRTPTKFTSFAWRQRRMALTVPENGLWVTWPHYDSYLGFINNIGSSGNYAKLVMMNHDIGEDSFSVTGTLERNKEELKQDFAFASLPGDIAVYIERLRPGKDNQLTSRETGVIGHEYELGKNTRVMYGRFGEMTIQGIGGSEGVHAWPSDWFNVGNKMGFVIKRYPQTSNIIHYHDMAEGEMTNRTPKLQEWFSLIGDTEKKTLASEGDWACVVTYLNQASSVTKACVADVAFEITGDTAICRIGEAMVRVDFQAGKTQMTESHKSSQPG